MASICFCSAAAVINSLLKRQIAQRKIHADRKIHVVKDIDHDFHRKLLFHRALFMVLNMLVHGEDEGAPYRSN